MNGIPPRRGPDLLCRNEEFLRRPTASEAAALRKEYGVRCVFVDDNYGETSSALGTVLRERFRTGPITVYEIV